MPSKPPPPTGPTRRTFETLLRELNERCGFRFAESVELTKAEWKRDEIEKKLENNPALKRARSVVNRLRKKHEERRAEYRRRLAAIRDAYHARGLVPSVIKMMDKLVEDIHQHSR